jgi:predicted transcriptional regulator
MVLPGFLPPYDGLCWREMMMRVAPVERVRPVLNTSEVASLIGTTKQTILNWLREGRIIEPERNPINNYRLWTDQDITRIREMLRERNLAKTRRR